MKVSRDSIDAARVSRDLVMLIVYIRPRLTRMVLSLDGLRKAVPQN